MADGRQTDVIVHGRRRRLPSGASLAAALAVAGPPILGRSLRFRRPRAPFCGTGACTQCLVRVNGRPYVRACRYVPAPGDRVEAEAGVPSVRLDLARVIDFAFPHGLDTHHGFRRPAALRPVYQRFIRRLAGFHRASDHPPATPPPTGRRIDTGVLVIGAGRAGRAAFARLTEGGSPAVLVDRDGRGSLDGTVVFLPAPGAGPFTAIVESPTGPVRLHARRVIAAPGGYDSGLFFANSDRPGVLTAEGAEALAGPGETPPFRHGVVVGGGSRAQQILDRFGPAVEAIVAPGAIAPELARRASEWEVPLYPRTLLLGAKGLGRVRAVELAPRGGGSGFTLVADAVVLAVRRLPNVQLFFQAGATMRFDPSWGAYRPDVAPGGQTSVAGLFAAGLAAGRSAPDEAERSGREAADRVLGAGEDGLMGAAPFAELPCPMDGYYRELLAHRRPRGKRIACACEDILFEEIEQAHRLGFRGTEVIKRYTGLGTGLCQGRYCLPDALLLLSILEHRPPSEVGYITQRPPVFPARLEQLAAVPAASAEPEP